MSVVKADNVTMMFGGLRAVSNVNMHIEEGEVVALIGPNGAGKTTFFNLMTGIYKATEGSVTFNGQELGGRKPHQVCQMGIARTFQNIRLFANMTTLENVMVGRHSRTTAGPLQAVLRTPNFKREEQHTVDEALRWLTFVGLADKCNELAVNLPYGQQRKLEIQARRWLIPCGSRTPALRPIPSPRPRWAITGRRPRRQPQRRW